MHCINDEFIENVKVMQAVQDSKACKPEDLLPR